MSLTANWWINCDGSCGGGLDRSYATDQEACAAARAAGWVGADGPWYCPECWEERNGEAR